MNIIHKPGPSTTSSSGLSNFDPFRTMRELMRFDPFAEMNAEALVLPDDSFDLVCGTGIIHHLELHTAFAEVARVLKPSGRAVFYEPMGHNPLIKLYRNRTPEMRTPDEHPLLVSDFVLAREYFGSVDIRYFHLFSIAGGPLRRKRIGRPIATALEAIDSLLLKPGSIGKHAWMVLLQLR